MKETELFELTEKLYSSCRRIIQSIRFDSKNLQVQYNPFIRFLIKHTLQTIYGTVLFDLGQMEDEATIKSVTVSKEKKKRIGNSNKINGNTY